jgi:hypothetical protein
VYFAIPGPGTIAVAQSSGGLAHDPSAGAVDFAQAAGSGFIGLAVHHAVDFGGAGEKVDKQWGQGAEESLHE